MPLLIKTEAIVLKRNNYSDAHRFITLFTKDLGKVSAMAKGVRKFTSRKRASLEIFNHLKVNIYQQNQHFLITETQLINSFPAIKTNLYQTTQAFQTAEIIDVLTTEEQAHPEIFTHFLSILTSIEAKTTSKNTAINHIKFILKDLGFGYPDLDSDVLLKNHIESIAERPLRSKEYLIAPMLKKKLMDKN